MHLYLNHIVGKSFLIVTLAIQLSSTCPDYCNCSPDINQVECNNKLLTSIPKDIPLDTEILLLDNNFIQRIDKDDLKGLTYLKSLQIYGNSITVIEDGSFQDLVNLTSLFMGDNQLHRITTETFTGLVNLESLWMGNFHQQNIHPCIFDRAFALMPNLISLIMTNNDFLYITDDLFYGLGKLRTLQITVSRIESISEYAFQHFPPGISILMGSLDFKSGMCCCGTAKAIEPFLNNKVSQCTRQNCKSENTICSIKYFSTCARDLTPTTTTTTTTKSPPIITAPTTISTATKTTPKTTTTTETTTSTMSTTEKPQTEPETPPPMTGTCPDRCTCWDKTVSCMNSHLRKIPKNIPGDTERLILSQNKIEKVRRYDLYMLGNLKELQLHENLINTIDDGSFNDLVNLTKLFLNDNRLEKITLGTFEGLTDKMKIIWMNKCSGVNPLIIEDGVFTNLENLENLNMKLVPFTYFSSSLFSGLVNLKFFEFSLDLVSVVNENAFSHFPESLSYIVTEDFNICCCSTARMLEETPRLQLNSICSTLNCNSTAPVCTRSYINTVQWIPESLIPTSSIIDESHLSSTFTTPMIRIDTSTTTTASTSSSVGGDSRLPTLSPSTPVVVTSTSTTTTSKPTTTTTTKQATTITTTEKPTTTRPLTTKHTTKPTTPTTTTTSSSNNLEQKSSGISKSKVNSWNVFVVAALICVAILYK